MINKTIDYIRKILTTILTEISNNIMIDNLGSLLLSPASKNISSDGVYTCRAENNGGSHELNTTLKLYGNNFI